MRHFLTIAAAVMLLGGCAPSTVIFDGGRGLSAQDQKALAGPLFSDRVLARKALRHFLDERHGAACDMLDGQYLAHDYMGAQFSVLATYNPATGGNDFGIHTASPDFNAALDMHDCDGDADLAAANALLDFMRHRPQLAAGLGSGEITLHDYAGRSYGVVAVYDKLAGARILIAADAVGGAARGEAYAPDPKSWLVVKGAHKLTEFYLPAEPDTAAETAAETAETG